MITNIYGETYEMRHSTRNGRCERGFTLVEIMVVVVIIGMLAGLVAPAVLSHQADAQLSTAKADIATIHQAATYFRMKVLKTPTMEELITKDSNGEAYLPGYDEEPIDPWKNPYVIRELEGRTFEVISLGPDGLEDTEDDLSSDRKGKRD